MKNKKESIEELERQIKELQQDYNYNLREYTIEIALEKFKGRDYELEKSNSSSIIRLFHHQVQFFRLLSDRINL